MLLHIFDGYCDMIDTDDLTGHLFLSYRQ